MAKFRFVGLIRTDFVVVKLPPVCDGPESIIPELEENDRHLKLTGLFSVCGVVAGVIHGL